MTEFLVGGVPEHFNLPWHLAIDSDAFAPVDCRVRFREYEGGTGAMATALDRGEIDVAVLLFEGALAQIFAGADFRIISTFVDSPLAWGIHVANDSAFTSVDLSRGNRYAISRFYSGSHLIAAVDASERGYSMEQLEFVVVNDIDGARKALRNGDADFFLWEKAMTQPLVDSGEFRRVEERVAPWPAFVVAARNACIGTQAEPLRSVLEIVNQVCRQFVADPGAPALVADRYGLQIDDARTWLASTHYADAFNPPARDAERVLNWLRKLGVVTATSAMEWWFPLDG